jgi:hypothetical protein
MKPESLGKNDTETPRRTLRPRERRGLSQLEAESERVALRWREIVMRQLCGTWEPSASMLTERFKQKPCESLSRNAAQRGGKASSSKEVPDKGMERRGLSYGGGLIGSTGNGRSR